MAVYTGDYSYVVGSGTSVCHVRWSPSPYDEAKRLTAERVAAMAKADEIADRVAAGDDDALWELLLEAK